MQATQSSIAVNVPTALIAALHAAAEFKSGPEPRAAEGSGWNAEDERWQESWRRVLAELDAGSSVHISREMAEEIAEGSEFEDMTTALSHASTTAERLRVIGVLLALCELMAALEASA